MKPDSSEMRMQSNPQPNFYGLWAVRFAHTPERCLETGARPKRRVFRTRLLRSAKALPQRPELVSGGSIIT
jgi:hypothetical protein